MIIPDRTLHRLFDFGVVIKGIDGALELAGGVLLVVVKPLTLNAMIVFLTAHEISEDPADLVANLLRNSVRHLSMNTTLFAGVYLLAHGLVKLFLVVALLLSVSTLTLVSPLDGQQIAAEDPADLARAAIAIDVSGLAAGDAPALAAIGRAVGNARIVMLGEPWHGDGGAIRARAGLVRYLHEHLGFDILAFEADFYSLNAGWPRVRGPDDVAPFARDNVFPFWSASRAAQPLWEYVALQRSTSRPLGITGFDIRHTGRLAHTELPRELRRRLVATFPHPDAAGLDTAAFFATLHRLLTLEWNYKAPAAERERFVGVLTRLARAWEAARL